MKQLPLILMGICFLILVGFCGYYAYNLFIKSGTEIVFVGSKQEPVVSEVEVTENKDHHKVLNGFEIWQNEVNISYVPDVKDLKKVIAEKEKELAANPANQDVLYSLGYYYLLDKDIVSAMNKFKELSVEGKDKQSAELAKAYIFYLNKEYDDALNIIEEMEANSPENPQILLVKAAFYKLQGNKNEALKCYSSALKKDPTNVNIQKAIKDLS